MEKTRLKIFLLLLGILTITVGCSRKPKIPSLEAYNKTNIQRLRNAYGLYVAGKGRAPADEAVFKEFLKNDPAAEVRLRRMGVDKATIDEIFISERDGQPFKIRYGISSDRDEALVFEATGVDGKRLVAFFEPLELDSVLYEEYWKGKKKGDSFEAGR